MSSVPIRRWQIILAVVIVVVVGVASFLRSGDSADSSSTRSERSGAPSRSPSPSPAGSAPAASPTASTLSTKDLTPALLTVDELPAGFSLSKAPSSSSSARAADTDNARCTELFHDTKLAGEAEPAAETSRAFATNELGPTVVHNVATFRATPDASSALTLLRPLVAECSTWTETDKTGPITYTVAELATTTGYGEESYAVTVGMTAHSYQFHTVMVLLRVSQHAAMLVLSSPDALTAADIHPLATRAAEKLTALPPT